MNIAMGSLLNDSFNKNLILNSIFSCSNSCLNIEF